MAKRTTDHGKIRQWVEERDGTPSTVKTTGDEEDPGILRIDFPGYSGEQSLQAISWEAFFEAFEENNLAFLYEEKTDEGELSRFFKFVGRESGD